MHLLATINDINSSYKNSGMIDTPGLLHIISLLGTHATLSTTRTPFIDIVHNRWEKARRTLQHDTTSSPTISSKHSIRTTTNIPFHSSHTKKHKTSTKTVQPTTSPILPQHQLPEIQDTL